MRTLLENIGEMITLQPLTSEQRGHSIKEEDLGRIHNAWLFCDNSTVAALGPMPVPADIRKFAGQVVDAKGALVLPGLVDAHTHTIFGGTRFDEFAQRLNGASYQEIAAKGGGIQASVKGTRQASDEELMKSAKRRLTRFLRRGVTTVEIKTGYGLAFKQELRLLKLIQVIRKNVRMEIVPTLLALHAVPADAKSAEAYVEEITKRLLPLVIENKLARYVDAFIESGYFSVEQAEPFIRAAEKGGLGVRVHADEFSNSGGAAAAAKWKAASADHLQHASKEGIQAMALSGTVAILLPGTSLYTGIPFTDARPFLEAKCAVAIASDFNPGSSFCENLAQLASLGALHCHLTSWQAIAAVTYVPALSLGLGDRKGALEIGFDADFAVYRMASLEEWLATMGQRLPSEVWLKGEKLHSY
ncbi:MAG: imidazolonepropionase [Deltaproteobacteria bacterium]|nr:imidazolonepropionase [Deltaproteobacteria bacterium]